MVLGGGCGLLSSCLRRRARRPEEGDDAPELDPVLLVSGMGGSILNARSRKSGWELRVWVRILLADLEFKKNLWSVYNAETGYAESLDPDVEIVVPDDDHGLCAIDILDPSWFTKLVHLTEVYHFHDMIDMLIGCGYEKGTTLFGFGYDFRQSNRVDKVINGLKMKLATAYKASGGKKVNIISHSMGGLLVRCFLSLHRDEFAKYVNKWICVACPFQGAPGCINDSLLTGLQFVYGFASLFFVSRWTMHQLLVECPSIYEMLPNPEFKWKQQPLIQVWRKHSEGKDGALVKLDTYDPTACTALFEEALRDNELNYDGKSVALPFNLSILKWAADTRKILEDAQLPKNVSFYNIFGISSDTPFDVRYGSEESPISDLSEVCHTMPEYSYVDGDGTVPAESAKADGFAAAARIGVRASHRGLLRDETVFSFLKQWLGIEQKVFRVSSTSKVMDADRGFRMSSDPRMPCISQESLSFGAEESSGLVNASRMLDILASISVEERAKPPHMSHLLIADGIDSEVTLKVRCYVMSKMFGSSTGVTAGPTPPTRTGESDQEEETAPPLRCSPQGEGAHISRDGNFDQLVHSLFVDTIRDSRHSMYKKTISVPSI